mgnify:FL=1
MDPYLPLILGTAKAGFEALAEYFRWSRTEEGKKMTERFLADTAKWDAFWADPAAWFEKLSKENGRL